MRASEGTELSRWCPSTAGGLLRYSIAGGAVKNEKVGQQMLHREADRSAETERSGRVRQRAAGRVRQRQHCDAGARARGGGSDTAVAAICSRAQVGGNSGGRRTS